MSYHKGFESQYNEIRIENLPITGTFPAWLAGTLIRNGPAQFEVGDESYRHWFDGLAMLHAFTFTGAGVAYANRFIRSKAYRQNHAEGRITYGEFATDPCRGLFGRVMSIFEAPQFGGNANVNVTKLADRFIAMTEYPMAATFDPETLETLGVDDYAGMNGQITTAHPHYDFARQRSYNYMLHMGRSHCYRLYAHDGTAYHELAVLGVEHPAYMHSFGMSENYLILCEFPMRLPGVFSLLLSGKPFIENYEWQPDLPAVFTMIHKDTGEIVARSEAAPFFAFHHVNAFERDGELIVDFSAYDDNGVVANLYLDKLRSDKGFVPLDGRFRRYRVPLDGRTATYETVSEVGFELPRLYYQAHGGQPYRYAYGVGTRAGTVDFTNQLVKMDADTGEACRWYEAGCYPGEPVFVPHPQATREDEGVILSVVLDSTAAHSFLLALDAATFEEIARATVPQHIPFGFHGSFFRA